MENLPMYVYLVFGLTTLIAIALFFKATNYSKRFLFIIFGWIIVQAILSNSGFYKNSNSIPPRFLILLFPPILLIIVNFSTTNGRKFIDNLSLETLTIFSIIRIPVEIVLFWLFTYKTIPQIMTFEGRNFDILSGISAPVIYYFVFVNKKLGNKSLLIWNFICALLLLNVVIYAILSIPSVVQQFSFNQPNVAIGYFPFVLLPSLLVPLVLFSHLASIRKIMLSK